jgi:hypothetical protein
MKFNFNDVVRLAVDIPESKLLKGTIGVVLIEFSDPMQAYEVEFANENGETLAQIAVLPEQIEHVNVTAERSNR